MIVWVTLYSGVLNSSFALGNRQQHPPSQGGAGAPVLVVMETEASPGSLEPLNLGPHAEPPSRAELVMKALAVGYPDRVGPAVYRDGDWAVPIRGDFYYYAGGRLLPERLRNQEADYDPQPFYTYPAALPPWKPPGQEEAARFKTQAERRSRNPPKRSQHFFDALWRAHTKAEAYDRVKTIRFLGRNMLVHYAIMEELALVEERINAEAQTNTLVRQWMHNLDTITAWNWRGIADTQSRSFHAYGAAIDLLPKSQRGLQTYWLWTSQAYPEWWAVPYEKRLHPPEAVIKAFEDYGFVWGGKWLFFDTMHFEYRPEILILSGLPLTDLR
ncbi:MAG: M15 family metallopeptidase [Treponema sp.]|nr:M15 family metallopeptidase [Treponema sp.]